MTAEPASLLKTPAPTGPILSVEDLRISFRTETGASEVLHGLSFDIAAGETLAIVGESGSGKSVTALSILRLLDDAKTRVTGRVLFDGADLLRLSESQMEDLRGDEIAMIFQDPMTCLNPVLTIGAQIAEVLVRHRRHSASEAREQSLALLEKVRIPAARSRISAYPHNLSGGQRQRVMIAMALACRPKLLIADEPTTALDVTIQAQILELIRELQAEEHMSVLFITHDMGVVAEIADRVLVMREGRLIESGRAEDIFASPREAYTQNLLALVPRPRAELARPAAFPREPERMGPADSVGCQESEPPILDVCNLITRFEIRSGLLGRVKARVHAVENVSFALRRGETLSLVGESGCGKSTLGRSILRLVEPVSGTVAICGKDMLSLPRGDVRAMRRRAQIVFQDPFASLNPRLRVGDAITEPILAHRLSDRATATAKMRDLITKVGLEPEMATRFPHEFSGGQRQRICIARALALDPELIIADEAVSALDVSVKAQIVNLLAELQANLNLACLFISHDMGVVERISHRVAVMYLGEIVEIGPSAKIFGRPQHPYTRRLLSAVPMVDVTRRRKRVVAEGEVGSPIHPVGYVPPTRRYREASPGHLVQIAE